MTPHIFIQIKHYTQIDLPFYFCPVLTLKFTFSPVCNCSGMYQLHVHQLMTLPHLTNQKSKVQQDFSNKRAQQSQHNTSGRRKCQPPRIFTFFLLHFQVNLLCHQFPRINRPSQCRLPVATYLNSTSFIVGYYIFSAFQISKIKQTYIRNINTQFYKVEKESWVNFCILALNS